MITDHEGHSLSSSHGFNLCLQFTEANKVKEMIEMGWFVSQEGVWGLRRTWPGWIVINSCQPMDNAGMIIQSCEIFYFIKNGHFICNFSDENKQISKTTLKDKQSIHAKKRSLWAQGFMNSGPGTTDSGQPPGPWSDHNISRTYA